MIRAGGETGREQNTAPEMSQEALDPQFLEAVRAALEKVRCDQPGLLTRSRPIRDLGLDSISLVEMVIHLEEALDITLDQDQIEGLRTFGDLQELVARFRPTLTS